MDAVILTANTKLRELWNSRGRFSKRLWTKTPRGAVLAWKI